MPTAAEAYADMTEMFDGLLTSMGLPKPSPEDFEKLMGPVLREAGAAQLSLDDKGKERDARDPQTELVMQRSLAGGAAFYDALQAELVRRVRAKKSKAGPRRK